MKLDIHFCKSNDRNRKVETLSTPHTLMDLTGACIVASLIYPEDVGLNMTDDGKKEKPCPRSAWQ